MCKGDPAGSPNFYTSQKHRNNILDGNSRKVTLGRIDLCYTMGQQRVVTDPTPGMISAVWQNQNGNQNWGGSLDRSEENSTTAT